MRNWEERTKKTGAELVDGAGVMVNETPSDDDLAKLKELGARFA